MIPNLIPKFSQIPSPVNITTFSTRNISPIYEYIFYIIWVQMKGFLRSNLTKRVSGSKNIKFCWGSQGFADAMGKPLDAKLINAICWGFSQNPCAEDKGLFTPGKYLWEAVCEQPSKLEGCRCKHRGSCYQNLWFVFNYLSHRIFGVQIFLSVYIASKVFWGHVWTKPCRW